MTKATGKAFDAMDFNHDGVLDGKELNQGLNAVIATNTNGVNMTEQNIPRLTDENGDGKVNLTEFINRNMHATACAKQLQQNWTPAKHQ